MAQPRLSVRKVREILRLHHEQALPARQIAAGVGCALSTVQECLRRAAAAGVGWPLPAQWDEAGLESRLYPPAMPAVDYPLPDFARIQAELAQKGVLVQFRAYLGFQNSHIGSHIVYFYNVSAGERKFPAFLR